MIHLLEENCMWCGATNWLNHNFIYKLTNTIRWYLIRIHRYRYRIQISVDSETRKSNFISFLPSPYNFFVFSSVSHFVHGVCFRVSPNFKILHMRLQLKFQICSQCHSLYLCVWERIKTTSVCGGGQNWLAIIVEFLSLVNNSSLSEENSRW